ncbi:MAG: acyl-CoA dehydrogenase family protein, partial [Actinobacteria bacterium]|nr:acyl-CoA dehydrogenase family protein [Actinomycetota bacterium]
MPDSTDRSRRYETTRYRSAVGMNWYRCDPTLQFLARAYFDDAALAWAEPHLDRIGEIMGGPVAERAAEIDRNPPYLERYDRWGTDTGRVVLPEAFQASRRDVEANNFSSDAFRAEAAAAGVDPNVMTAAWGYLLSQADIGIYCSVGTGRDMVERLSEAFAPEPVQARVRELLAVDDGTATTAQMFTERSGGADLRALETIAEPDGDHYRLNGLKWFVSNAHSSTFIVLAKIAGSDAVMSFLVLRERMDGTPNGVIVHRLKDKLGTKSVPSGEVELVDAEGWLLARKEESAAPPSSDHRIRGGLGGLMEMTNGARIGIANMGLGSARRALVEAILYCQAREAFGKPVIEQPLARRKLAELIVEVEAAQALVFEGFFQSRMRISAPIIKMRACRLGITAASDALELHGGNGYIEDWPTARILRDAQVNPVWEGPDNILCLDIARAIRRNQGDVALLERLRDLVNGFPGDGSGTEAIVIDAVADLAETIEHWKAL